MSERARRAAWAALARCFVDPYPPLDTLHYTDLAYLAQDAAKLES